MDKPVLEIRQMELGPMANFVYLIADPKTRKAMVIDPGWDAQVIREALDKEGWKLSSIFLTHNHFDHVQAVGEVLRSADVPVYIHQHDAGIVERLCRSNLKPFLGGETVSLGGISLEFMHTPGHTEGSSCLRIQNQIATGDTLFINGCGRVDLPTSDPEKMYSTLKKLAGLDESCVILPGHDYGPSRTASMGEEKKNNPFLKLALHSSLQDFLKVLSG